MKTVFLFIILFPMLSFSHSGRTDSSGCHNDRQRGGYHCHNSRSPSVNVGHSRSLSTVTQSVFFNTNSLKYHSHSCRWASVCTVNCITVSKDEALRRGGVACKVCGGH